MRGSRRDQLSFPYVAWKLGFPYATFPAKRSRTIASVPPGRTMRPPLLPRLAAAGWRGARSALEALGLEPACRRPACALRARLVGRGSWRRVAARPRSRPPRSEPPRQTRARPSRPAHRAGSSGRRDRRGPLVEPVPATRGSRAAAAPLGGPGSEAEDHRVRPGARVSLVGLGGLRLRRGQLSRYYDVVLYDSWAARPECDVLFMVKERSARRRAGKAAPWTGAARLLPGRCLPRAGEPEWRRGPPGRLRHGAGALGAAAAPGEARTAVPSTSWSTICGTRCRRRPSTASRATSCGSADSSTCRTS